MIDLNDLVWWSAVIQLTHVLPNLHFMAVLQRLEPLLLSISPMRLKLALAANESSYTCCPLTTSFTTQKNPVIEVDKRQWES